MENNINGIVTEGDRIMNYIGFIGILIVSFTWGWNRHVFKKDK